MKKFLTMVCTSYTTCILIFAFFSEFDFLIPIDRTIIFKLFIISLSISALIHLFEKLSFKFDLTFIQEGISMLLMCYFVVGVEGLLFKLFPFKWTSFLYISIIIIPTFLITYSIVYLTTVKYTNDINEKIGERKKKEER